MRLLLDTHVVLWALADDVRLGPATAEMLASASTEVLVSAATIWEVEVKVATGRLSLADDLVTVLAATGVEPLPISWFHARSAGRLPLHHRDPFDRMLIAQARCERLTLLSHDAAFTSYDVELLDPIH